MIGRKTVLDIKGYTTFKKIKPINKGWSSDKKHYIETVANKKLLLRIAGILEYDKKNSEFEMMKRIAESGVSMSKPIDFGICDNGKSAYSLFTWCDGEDADIVLPKMTKTRQYELGVKSGLLLRKIHTIPAPDEQEPW